MSDIKLTRASLVPMDGDNPTSDVEQHIPVQFNPNSLRITLSNTIGSPSAGRGTTAPTQFVDKSESSLSVQLIFDTTIAGVTQINFSDVATDNANSQNSSASSRTTSGSNPPKATNHQANSDVRKLTQAIVDAFMKPDEEHPTSNGKPAVPKKCRFQWGSFAFVGMISSYNETIDFFSPEGVPLRSTLAITLKEDKFQYLFDNAASVNRNQPKFASALPAQGAAQAAASQGQDPRNWRDLALFNGIEDARAMGLGALSIPQVNLENLSARVGSPEVGFSVGSSGSLGSSIPGAFQWK